MYRTPYGPKAERDRLSNRVRALTAGRLRPIAALSERFRRSRPTETPRETQLQLS